MDPSDAKTAAREPVAEPAALPWGMDKNDVQKSSLTALTDEKLARFVIGHQKKTKYEKEREERELKKRKADEEAAAMYAKFVASFEDEDETHGKAFVRSGSSGDVYRLQSTKSKLSDMDRLVHEMKQKQQVRDAPPSKKRREMDLLVEEIKSREQSTLRYDDSESMEVTGSFDNGDPDTTNLYVGNLASSVTEEKLERVFSKYGRINSIKIMWPRSEEERSRRRMCGFVSFFSRREADDARIHVNDSELDGQRIVVGWGKAVKIESNEATTPGIFPVPTPATPVVSGAQPKVVVQMPSDEATRRRIDHLAAYVAKDGLAFENAVRLREASNPLYAFLTNSGLEPTPDAIYYQWRVYAFAMGDNETMWRDTPFQMTMDGPVWVPPPRPRLAKSRNSPDTRRDRSQRRRSRSYSRSRSRDRRRRRSRSSSRSRSRSRSRGSRSRASRSNRHSRSGSRDRRRRSRSQSHSSGSSDESDRRHRSHSRSRHRQRSRSPRQHDDAHRRSRYHSPSPSHNRSPKRRTIVDDSVLKKDETLLTGQQLARARDLERGREPNRLPREEYNRFMELLDGLTLERESIKQTMGCALDNSECAVELVHILRKQFHQDDASAVQLVAYLYVASDILHNSSAAVKNASLFRTTFQDCLPEILDRLRRVQQGIQGRMSALAMRDKVLAVLTAWGSWSLFPPHYLVGLNATFMRKIEEDEYLEAHADTIEAASRVADEEKLRKACSHAGIVSSGSVHELVARLQWLKEFTAPAAQPTSAKTKKQDVEKTMTKDTDADVDGLPMDEENVDDDVDGEPLDDKEDEDVDGEPLEPEETGADDEDVDGEPLDPEDPITGEDLDGEPLDEEEDVDGEPLDEDLDGEPM